MSAPKFKPQYRRLLFIDGEIRKGKYPNCTGLAREWEVSPRTVQRDIDYLRWELGAPMEYDAIRHGFHYTDRSWFLPSVDPGFRPPGSGGGAQGAPRQGSRGVAGGDPGIPRAGLQVTQTLSVERKGGH